jgi:WD40 repeat protein
MPRNHRVLIRALRAVGMPELLPGPPRPARYTVLAALAAHPAGTTAAGRWIASPGNRLLPRGLRTAWLLSLTGCLALGASAGYFTGWADRPATPYGQTVDHAEVQQVINVGDAATGATFGPGGILAVGTARGAVTLIDMHDTQHTSQLKDPGAGPVTRTVFSPQGSVLAAGSDDGTVRLWLNAGDTSSHPTAILPMREDGKYGGAVNDIAVSPDSRIMAVASSTSMVRIWDVSHPDKPIALATPGRPHAVTRLAFASHGSVLAVGSTDGTVQLWDMTHPDDPQNIDGGLAETGAPVTALAFSANKKALAVGNSRGAVQLWNISQPTHPRKVDAALAIGYTNDLTFNSPGYTLAASNSDGTVRLWKDLNDLMNPQLLTRPTTQGELSSITFAADDDTLAVTGTDGTVQLWTA